MAPDAWEEELGGELFEWHDPFAPLVNVVPQRERVESPHLPDSYLVQFDPGTPIAPTALEWACYFPAQWIEASRRAVERSMAER